MEKPIKIDDLGGFPTFFGNIHIAPSSEQTLLEVYPLWFLQLWNFKVAI